MKRKKTRKTGFHVWVHGHRYWHRTYQGAEARAVEAQYHGLDARIECVLCGRNVDMGCSHVD